MKTLDEVIAYFDNQTQQRHVYLTEDAEDIYNDAFHYLKKYRDNYEARNDQVKRYQKAAQQCEEILKDYIALKQIALRQYCAETQDNPPLTWDELKQMEGKPVWLEDSNQQGEWVLLSGMEDDELYFVYRTCNEYKIYRKEQGTLWKAYRKERS